MRPTRREETGIFWKRSADDGAVFHRVHANVRVGGDVVDHRVGHVGEHLAGNLLLGQHIVAARAAEAIAVDADGDRLILCQSNAPSDALRKLYPVAEINPLGDWTGGTDVDTGAANRKLGSDMADSVTGGGLHGKDLSKADVSVNIYAFLKAQETGKPVTLCCAIGDDTVDGRPYEKIVEIARNYIRSVGGFEQFAEWGLV